MGVRVAVDVGLNLSAHEADEAAGFEIESVLRRFAVDPQALAEQGLAPLVLFKGVELEEGEIDGYLDVLAMTPADLARGLTYAKVGDAGDQTAFVVSIAIGGAYRGLPGWPRPSSSTGGTPPRSAGPTSPAEPPIGRWSAAGGGSSGPTTPTSSPWSPPVRSPRPS